MKYLLWLLKAAIFFALFAFALNNQQNATINFFFGRALTLPLVLVILASFALGALLGVLVMVPRWWRRRRDAKVARQQVRDVEQALAANKPAGDASPDAPAPDQERHKTDPSLPISYGP